MADGALIDPDKGAHIIAVGRKRQGKSHLARRLFDSYPYDSMILDVTGDIWADFVADGTADDPNVKLVKLTAPLPARLPEPDEEGRRQVFVISPDMGDADAMDDLDRCVGLAMRRGRMLLWIDEVGIVSPVGQTGPNMRRYLHHGGHHFMTGIACGPRPVLIDPLQLSQADHAFVFPLSNPADRRRVADSIGWDPKAFDAGVQGLKKYEFLQWSADNGNELLHMPPLPPERGSQAGR
jgi:hypothetical protein